MNKYIGIAVGIASFALIPTNAHAVPFFAIPFAAIGFSGSFGAALGASAAASAISLGTIAQIGMGVLGAASTFMQGMAARQQANADAAQQEINAKLEYTQGLQRDTQRREELERTVGAIRGSRGGRGMTSPTATAFLNEANEYISSDRIVELLNSRQRSADLMNSARDSRRRGRTALMTGAARGGMSLFQTAAYHFS